MKALRILLGALVIMLGTGAAGAEELVVSAAISLKGALEEVAAQYGAEAPEVTVRFNFGASGALAKQLENGAPVDVFISAGAREMNGLEQKGLLATGSRMDLLGNTLVLIAPREGTTVQKLGDLADAEVKRIAIGNEKTVPAGAYAAQVLATAKLTAALEPKLIRAENVRQVLTYVETGNVDAGFVYGTDAKSSTKVRVVAVLPEASHEPIVYPAAVLVRAPQAIAAEKFLRFLQGEKAGQVFARAGFTKPPIPAAH